MKRVLVTGGAGFIGSNFVHYLLQADPEIRIVNLDLLTYAGNIDNLEELPRPENHTFVQGDVCDLSLLIRLLGDEQIDTIVHFAAETHVDRSIVSPEPFLRTNVTGTFSLLEAARQVWIDGPQPAEGMRFHHVSTDEVFGTLTADSPAFSEQTPYDPSSPYAASKAAADHLVRAYARTYRLPVTISNCSNNYGPRQFPEKLMPLMILQAVAGKTLPVYGDGQQIRDWLYVVDHCEAIHTILQHGSLGETYNIGGNNQPPNLTVVRTLCDLLDEIRPLEGDNSYHDLIRFVTDRPGHDRRYAMDISKIGRELNWKPRFSLADGIRATVEWYLSHGDWTARIQSRSEYQQWMNQNYQNRQEMS